MSRTYSSELKAEVVKKLTEGATLSAVSKEYGIPDSTISGWLKRSAKGGRAEELELGKLRRENEMLYQLLGRMTADKEKEEVFKKRRYL